MQLPWAADQHHWAYGKSRSTPRMLYHDSNLRQVSVFFFVAAKPNVDGPGSRDCIRHSAAPAIILSMTALQDSTHPEICPKGTPTPGWSLPSWGITPPHYFDFKRLIPIASSCASWKTLFQGSKCLTHMIKISRETGRHPEICMCRSFSRMKHCL